jgi:hypothetical protein
MSYQCPLGTKLIEDGEYTQPKWSAQDRTILADMAHWRNIIQRASADLDSAIDPIQAKAIEVTRQGQEYWERLVFEAGQLGHLRPTNTKRVQNFIRELTAWKTDSLASIRNPIINAGRNAAGTVREMGIYRMQGEVATLDKMFKSVAKARGVKLAPNDMVRLLEEGLTPQRLSVFGNTDAQIHRLTERYNVFHSDMLERGFTDDDMLSLLDQASVVSSQWDSLRAAQLGMGLDVDDLFNIGYVKRELSDTARSIMTDIGALKWDENAVESFITKSRSTWEYLVENHALAASMTGLQPDQLTELVANPGKFAEYLATNLKEADLNLLVDSGVLSKIPMLTNDVAEMMVRSYKLPVGMSADLFIMDPAQATAKAVERLTEQVHNSAIMKLVHTEGAKAGWVITLQMKQADPARFGSFVKLSDIVGDTLAGPQWDFVHPTVAYQLKGIIKVSKSPGDLQQMAVVANWLGRSFQKQALGNPITASAYLMAQYGSNFLSTVGAGVSAATFNTTLFDMMKLAQGGLKAFDDVKPYRVVSGETLTQRQFYAFALRNLSPELLPGLSTVGKPVFDWTKLDPRYAVQQANYIRAMGNNGVAEYGKAVGKFANGVHDAVLTPALKMAQLIDMSGQIAVMRGKAQLPTQNNLAELNNVLLGLGGGERIADGRDLLDEVRRHFPMMDDTNGLVQAVSFFAPFHSWGMLNLPLQIQDAMRRPQKWIAWGRAYSLLTDNGLEGEDPIQGEFQQWELDQHGVVLRYDRDTKQTHMLMTDSFDPKWGAATFVMDLFDRDESQAEFRSRVKGETTQKWMSGLMSNTYLSGFYKAASGIDPLTGVRRDESPLAFNQFAGIPMPAAVAAVLSISPIIASLDRLPVISGTRAVDDPRTGAVLQQAKDGWLGNQGTVKPKQLAGMESALQVLGSRYRVIDGIRNMQYTEKDTTALIKDIQGRYQREQLKLAHDVRTGAVKEDSDSYRKRNTALNTMVDTVLQLNVDLGRIELWATVNGVPSLRALEELKKRNIATSDLPIPGAAYYQQQINAAMEAKGK